MAAASTASQADIDKAVAQLAGLRTKAPNTLFFIARSKNQNIVVYEALKSGEHLKADKPVDVYWLDIDPTYQAAARKKGVQTDRVDVSAGKQEKKSDRSVGDTCQEKSASLNMIENKMAYGIATEAVANQKETYFCRLVALPERPVTVVIDAEGKLHAYITINGQKVDLIRIYVNAVDRTLLPPKVTFVELIGVDAAGKYHSERINP